MPESKLERRDPKSLGRGVEQFDSQIHPEEILTINQRRAKHGRKPVELVGKQVVPTVGLALSGGGVRSAAFSLGVLQALNQHNVIKNIDYLSTVSGGGYVGSSLIATMTVTEGQFVFGDQPTNPPAPAQADVSDTAQVGHIRNYSNYLIPYGFRDVMTGLAIILRGWVANLGLVLPVILITAAATALFNPTPESLKAPNVFGFSDVPFIPSQHFGLTIFLALVGLVLFFFWALRRSFLKVNDLGEFRNPWPAVFGWFLAALGISVLLEIQPAVVAAMFDAAGKGGQKEGVFSEVVVSWVTWLATVTAPVAAAATLFNKHLAELIKVGNLGTGWTSALKGLFAHAAVWIGGLALPLIIWVGYLHLCYWAIPSDPPKVSEAPAAAECLAKADAGSLDLTFELGSLSGSAKGTFDCELEAAETKPHDALLHRPSWLRASVHYLGKLSDWICGLVGVPPPSKDDSRWSTARPAVVIYTVSGVLILLLSLLLRPNANSLNRLYQDRLSKTFLFDPRHREHRDGISRGRDFRPLDIQLSTLRNGYAPYLLINAAVNIQGADFANRRGRNADFFLFSPRYVGSPATGYVETELYEPDPPDLDLGKALSISGAAFSSEMGSKSVRALAPTLALLNVRLGYWLRNPVVVEKEARSGAWMNKRSGGPRLAPWYLLREMLGQLDEETSVIYVTDGGHIENLGIYELLRRRCKLIVVVDGEADPTMNFPSFIDVQRYARIDFGVRFRIPWRKISDTTLAWMKIGSPGPSDKPPAPSAGPHVTIGKIEYSGGQTGYLVYIKSSLTGDENDYVRDYGRRNPNFPHESTGDQFFSEEQFEVYRSLGFHSANGFLGGTARALLHASLPFSALKEIRAMLDLPDVGPIAEPATD